MSRFDDLPPDLGATLSLLLDRGKSYAEIAAMLAIPESAVRERAHAALDALSASPARAQAPPTQPASPRRPPRTRGPQPPGASRPSASTPPGPAQTALPASRRGGALLLLGIVAVVVVAVVLIAGGGGGSSKAKNLASSTSTGTSSTAAKTSTTAGKPHEDKRLTLSSPEPSSKSIGAVEILSEGSKYAYYIAAANLPPSKGFFYVVWLYNSPTSHEAVSRAPNVGANGRLQGGALLPANASKYHEMLLTRETSSQPTQPGPVVLKGPFTLH
jgi:hypothetical protein